jgi:putative ABC transport system permease protein
MADIEPLADVVAAETSRHRFLGALTAVLAGFALLLAMLGLYATISYDVAQRAREFAIRIALGGEGRQNYGLVLARGAVLSVAGVLGGGLLGAVITTFLAAQVPAVSALTLVEQSMLVAGVLVLATLALVLPARRASSVEPSSLLRE